MLLCSFFCYRCCSIVVVVVVVVAAAAVVVVMVVVVVAVAFIAIENFTVVLCSLLHK